MEISVLTKKQTVNNVPLLVYDKEDIEKLIGQLRFIEDGVQVRVKIKQYNERKEKEEQRSIAQNKYYHKLLDIICDHTGDTHMDMHDKLKVKFLARPYILEDREYMIVSSTTGLTPKEFGDYLEKIFHWASEDLEMILPSASDYY